MSTLIIENVNFDLLLEQRKALASVLIEATLTEEEQSGLDGLQALLDVWYDKAYPVEE